MQINFNSQAHLFIGQPQNIVAYTNDLLQNLFCKQNGCKKCTSCMQIKQHAHANLLWLKPERQYTLEQIDVVFETIALTLEDNQRYFIVLESADLLNQACSNRLLKSIEEPPKGYYFILLTKRLEAILPTIRSRCVVTNLTNLKSNSTNWQTDDQEIKNFLELTKFFTCVETNPNLFLKAIDKAEINEFESLDLLDTLITFWSKKYKEALLTKNNNDELNYSSKMLDLLKNALAKPPMPGSSKIFWKNLFINLPKAT